MNTASALLTGDIRKNNNVAHPDGKTYVLVYVNDRNDRAGAKPNQNSKSEPRKCSQPRPLDRPGAGGIPIRFVKSP